MYDSLTADEAAALVTTDATNETATLAARRLYVGLPTADLPPRQPDHWQDGAGYNGPLPRQGSEGASAYLTTLERAYVVEDCLSDIVQRRRNGILGAAPSWTVEPDRDEDGQPDEGESDPDRDLSDAVTGTLRAWATNGGGPGRPMLAVLKRWLDGMSVGGTAYLRVWVPPERVDAAEGAADAEGVLEHIFVEALDADEATVHTDRSRMASVSVVVHAADDGKGGLGTVDVSYLESFSNGAATAVNTLSHTEEAKEPWFYDLGGRLLLHEGRMRPLLDTGAISNQRDLNTHRTMLAINGHKAGFPSLHFIGVEAPLDEKGEPVAYPNGPGRTGFWQVAPRIDANGQAASGGSGSITQIGPVDNASLREDAAVAREAIYRGARQGHVLASFGANLSGDALLQLRGEFVQDLIDGADTVNGGGRAVLETAWRLACAIKGTPERASQVRAVFACRPSAGPLTTGERTAILAQYDKGLVSAETAMGLLGIDDIEAEKGRMAAEADAETERRAAEGAALFPFPDAEPNPVGGDGAVQPADLDPQTGGSA